MNDNRYCFEEQKEMISPQLIYYPAIIRENIQKMIQLAGTPDRLWPHVKTHKSTEVVRMQMEMGITRFKCATIAEAEMVSDAGAAVIALAYPLVGPNIARFLSLVQARPDTVFYAIGDDDVQIGLLGDAARGRGVTVRVLMDIDTGQHRTGVPLSEAAEKYRRWSGLPGIQMCGFHCYDGHRHESDRAVREREVRKLDEQIESVKEELSGDGLDDLILIMGGTPSFPCHAALCREYLSPGTCVIQDAGYRKAYPDMNFVPGAAILTRVVSRPGADLFTMDLGTKAVASDPRGERAELAGMEYVRTVCQNEEHWVVQVPPEHIADIPAIGTELFAIPVHICPTSALYPAVATVEDGCQTGWWKVTARDRKISF